MFFIVSNLNYRYSITLSQAEDLDQCWAVMGSKTMELEVLQNRLDQTASELQGRQVQLDMRAAELDVQRARLDAQEEGLKHRQLEELSKIMKLKQVGGSLLAINCTP